jgi:stearoyl-CoA desaturase (delta-9 desaturase)
MRSPFPITKNTMVASEVINVLAFVLFCFIGTMHEWAIAIAVYCLRTILITAVVHRLLSHRAFKTHRWIEYVCSFFAMAGSHSSVISWVAVHRQHHRYSDKEKDPHSPKYSSIFDIHFRLLSNSPDIRYVPDLLRSKFHLWCHQWHWMIAIVCITLLYLLDPMSILYVWFVPWAMGWFASNLINSLNHSKVGYSPYNTDDQSNNNLLTGYVTMGEGWHNNHHNAPASPKFGERWWELDVGWWFIKLIRIK